jgi:hypothetical protein
VTLQTGSVTHTGMLWELDLLSCNHGHLIPHLPLPVSLTATTPQARVAVQQQAEAAHIMQQHLQQQQLPGMPLAMPILQVCNANAGNLSEWSGPMAFCISTRNCSRSCMSGQNPGYPPLSPSEPQSYCLLLARSPAQHPPWVGHMG